MYRRSPARRRAPVREQPAPHSACSVPNLPQSLACWLRANLAGCNAGTIPNSDQTACQSTYSERAVHCLLRCILTETLRFGFYAHSRSQSCRLPSRPDVDRWCYVLHWYASRCFHLARYSRFYVAQQDVCCCPESIPTHMQCARSTPIRLLAACASIARPTAILPAPTRRRAGAMPATMPAPPTGRTLSALVRASK